MQVDEDPNVLLRRPLDDLRDPLNILRTDLAGLWFERRPADGKADCVKSEGADLGEVVERERRCALVPLTLALLSPTTVTGCVSGFDMARSWQESERCVASGPHRRHKQEAAAN